MTKWLYGDAFRVVLLMHVRHLMSRRILSLVVSRWGHPIIPIGAGGHDRLDRDPKAETSCIDRIVSARANGVTLSSRRL